MTDRHAEALEKLNQGIQESRREVQQRTMNLAQDYFSDSAEALKQQIKENRDTLQDLPDQIPGGREEVFQALFQELMDNYRAMEERINEAQENVANLDTDQIRRQGEVEATDAARRQARELGIDLTQIEGTGADGRIIVSDVVEAAEAMEGGTGGEAEDQEANGQAEQVAQQAQDAAGQATDQTQQVAGQATDQAGQVAGQAQEAAGGAAQQAQDTAGQVTDQAGQVAGQAQEAVGGLTGDGQQGGGGPLGGVTDQVGQVAGQAQEVAGQATDQAGQVAGQAQEAAGGAAQQAQDTAGQAAQQGQQAAGQAAQQAGGGQQQGGQQQGGQQPNATQAAQQKAQQLGVDLSQVEGSGADGRITVRDVQQAANQ